MIKFDSERSLEDFIFGEFKSANECAITDEEYANCYRQFDTKGYGVCDLVYVSAQQVSDTCEAVETNILVVELKNEQVKPADIAQICRYRTYFQRATKHIKNVKLSFILAVPEGVINSQDCCYLTNALEDIVDVYTFKLDPSKGITFSYEVDFFKVNEDLSSIESILPIEVL